MLVDDNDAELIGVLAGARLVADEQSGTTWMDAERRAGGALCRRDSCLWTVPCRRPGHTRCDAETATGLRRAFVSALYDPALDLAVSAADGQVAGYALFWFDPVTKVGMVEPMRVEDEYQRRGLARAMLAAGLDRLAARGALRLKTHQVLLCATHSR